MPRKIRLWIGGVLAAAAIVSVLLAASIPFTGMSSAKAAGAITGLLILAEVLAAAALIVLGKELYQHISAKLKEMREKAAQ